MVISLLIQPVFATNTNDDDELLDVVLVLDQSGSMKQNDPNGLMKEAAKTFITMLPSNSRGNIITFNRSRSMWKNDLTELSDDDTTKSAASWVSDVEYTGDTDMSNAVADAINMFDVNDGRVHAILLFSDGRNDFGYEKNKEIESDERLNDALALAKNAGIQVYCIGYGEEMVNTSDVPYQKLDSIAIADSDNRITTQTDAKSINDYFNTVIAELMGSNTIPVVDNKIEIASNVKEANINISCNDKVNDAGIKLIDNNGNEVNFNNNQNAKLYLYEYSAVIKLYEPVAGTYTIVTNKNINISATYIPYYQYVLNTSIIDNNGNEVSSLSNGDTLTIVTSIQQDGKILNLGGEGLDSEGAADDALVLGSSFDSSSAEIIIAANGSITRTELPADPDDLEIATVGYVKSLGDISGSLEIGSWSIAMQDFTNPLYQSEMDEGVFYSVPQNAADQYIQIDPATGRPAETQASGVTDKKVDHFVIMYKAPTSKLVMNLGERKIAPDFNDVPLLSKDNTFTGTNVFKDAQKQTSSVDPQLADVSANSYVTKTELVNYFTANAPWSNVVTAEPEVEDMVPGQIYFLVEQ